MAINSIDNALLGQTFDTSILDRFPNQALPV